jgi:hypothetical protein
MLFNRSKPTIVYANGYETFTELSAGERLVLPERWFDGTLDKLPKSYFEALPTVDGRELGARTKPTARRAYGLSGLPSLSSLQQVGLTQVSAYGNAAAGAAFSYAADTVNAQLPPEASGYLAAGISAAGGFANMTPGQQTVVAEQATYAIANAMVPGAGFVLQMAFSAIGNASGGSGYTSCPPPIALDPPLTSVGAPGSFENAFNKICLAEWNKDQTCPPTTSRPQGLLWSPVYSWLAWNPLLAATIAAWNQTTDASGAGTSDIDGQISPSPSTPGVLTISRTILVPTTVSFGGTKSTQYYPTVQDGIGIALNFAALAANASIGGSGDIASPGDPAGWAMPPSSVVSFTVNAGGFKAPSHGQPIYTPPGKLGPPLQVSRAPATSVGKTVAVVAGTGAAGLGLYAYLTHQSYAAAAKALWHKASKYMPRVPSGG